MLRVIAYCMALGFLGNHLVNHAIAHNWWALAATCVVGAWFTSRRDIWLGTNAPKT